MIIDFTITNFRSIKDRQTFSLYSESESAHLKENIIYPANNKIGVLRSAGIYGANASGKSNVLLAFEALRFIACRSGDLKDGDALPCYEPYRLSDSTSSAPVSFELEFVTDKKVRYLYSVSFNSNRILNESLGFYPSRKIASLFKRTEDMSWNEIEFGGQYKGGKKKAPLFENNSYLAKAGNSADSPPVIREVFNYLRRGLVHVGSEEKVQLHNWKEDSEIVNQIRDILVKIDIGISGVEFKENDLSEVRFPDDMPEKLKNRILKDFKSEVLFQHVTEQGGVERFAESLESSGTIKIFNLFPLILQTFKKGGVLILDELDNSFHPILAELIIKLFNDPTANKNNAQLIFSTHNIHLMSAELLRRDQIWFTEKNNGATSLYSLDEYDKSTVRSNSPFGKWYEEGRFGAIPNIDICEISEILNRELS